MLHWGDGLQHLPRWAMEEKKSIFINSKDISGFYPADSPQWIPLQANVDGYMAAAGDTGHQLLARNAQEVTEKFGEVAAMMDDEMEIEEYS